MSLILEALRKSEAERRRGAAPDVAMELPPTPAARARAMPAWLVPALVIGALAIVAALWWWQRAPVSPVPAALPAADDIAAARTAEPVVVAAMQPQPVMPPTAATPATTPPPNAAISPSPPSSPARALPPATAPTPAEPPASVAGIDDTSLPPVKLSMHIWDAAPARRFVILDGQRMAEGDRNGQLSVIAIERDGVVIERNGQRARVPLP